MENRFSKDKVRLMAGTRRFSRQRQLILDTVCSLHCHPTADDIYSIVKSRIPGISLGTVYRNLNVLAEEGLIQKIALGKSTERYDSRLDSHYHMICLKCGRVVDVPLSYEDQDFLHTACQESGVPYALALAVIEQETDFRNVMGDDGASCGYMQVQEKWHRERMERLGVTDLMDPFGNFRVGCDFLAELMGKYPTQEALTAYNSGSPGYNQYSYDVMANYEKWKELVGDDVSGIKG